MSIQQAAEQANALREQMQKAVIGQYDAVDHVLAGFLAGGHVLLEGVPGLGKTLMVLALSRAFGGEFSRVQFTPDLMPSDVTGHSIYDMSSAKFHVRKGPVFANLLLAEEINPEPRSGRQERLENYVNRFV